ncbi:MAG TPA: UbiA family prenyltransferase, partial [Gemmatimonadales bacterium]|nr:UbiA family prenyltransferase [Gemmatimonadales bacterium]
MTVLDVGSPAKPQFLALFRALRVHQWVKNLLVLVPVVLDHKVFQPHLMLRAMIAFAAFCCAASGAYVLNDLLDRDADRRHKVKRNRPFAANVLSRSFGAMLVPLLFAAALLASLWLPPKFLSLLTMYVVLTTAYSIYLKRIAVLDVLLLAGLYTLRVLAGVAASNVRFSTWLLAFSMFLFLSLAFLKRYAELSELQGGAAEGIERRGYLRGDREWLGSMGGASGYLSVLVLALYINSEEVVALYRNPLLLWLICPLLLLWISRMWLLAHRGRIHQDP